MSKLYEILPTKPLSSAEMKRAVAGAGRKPEAEERLSLLKVLFSLLDLTSLNTTDSSSTVRMLTQKAVRFPESYPDTANIAAICVWPHFITVAKEELGISDIKLAVVSASFPTAQTFSEVRLLETSMAARMGADEIDVVMPLGIFLNETPEKLICDMKAIREAAGETTLKVILETGLISNIREIYRASLIAMESGADFIKTSTGKSAVSATPEAVWVMCRAIRDYYNETGIMIGIKPAGGIATADDALTYYFIVKEMLGDKWLNPTYFRIGASRLANNILAELFPGKPACF